MAKKKKAGATSTVVRRTSRRGKQVEDAAAEGEASTADQPPDTPAVSASDQSESEQPSVSTPKTIPVTKPCQVPIVALHKKFGKYRCLFNNEDGLSKKCDLGSDSETSSSLEIRVIDPCASSESDSNAADTQSDTNNAVCNLNPLPASEISLNNSRVISPAPLSTSMSVFNNVSESQSIPLLSDSCQRKEKVEDMPSELLPFQPKMNHDNVTAENEIDCAQEGNYVEEEGSLVQSEFVITDSMDEQTEELLPLTVEPELDHEFIGEPESKPELPKEQEKAQELVQEVDPESEQVEHQYYGDDDDDEVITIVQIVEDDNQGLYYDIQMDSPSDQNKNEANETKDSETEFQQHFENLNLTLMDSNPPSPMECSTDLGENRTPPCNTSQLQYAKDVSFDLTRPDPSLTPSSTLSDDSNSSRVTEQNPTNSNDSAESSPTGVRRSSRIKTISTLKQKTKGYGLVKTPLKKALITQTKLKLEELGLDSQEKLSDASSNGPSSPSFPVPIDMPVKVKSRWRRSSELEMGAHSPANSPLASPGLPTRLSTVSDANDSQNDDNEVEPLSKEAYDRIIDDRMKQYNHLDENEYLCERMISRDTKKMICDCFLTKEEVERGELGCGEDCLNRLLMIECNFRCPVGDRCTNRRFQKVQNANLKVFYADKKGCGVEASVDIPAGEFLMEYVGEVLDYDQFYKRAQAYSEENNAHHYFMSLKGDSVIDATGKGNISRFINHSCDPNAETQKWTVNGELRIGFFSKRDIVGGEEITFDYQFKRFGKVAQRCYCGADSCRGWIGGEPDSDDEYDEEEDDDVSTSKSGDLQSNEEGEKDAKPRQRRRKPKRDRTYKPTAPDLVQDADIEEDLEALSRTGIKNQSHTLRLSRTLVRAKSRAAHAALLRLLRDADLPCRRLFLDYRGLRLLAPWCTDAPIDFKLEMLQTVDRLPIPNKTMVQESRFFTIVERWRSAVEAPAEPVFVDEATGLPIELPNRSGEESSPEKIKENAAMLEKVKDLSSQLLERWSSLKEVFKIPKKERIQQMKEHERQANVERRAADSSGSRDRDREKERDKDKDREKDRERDRRDDRDRREERRDDRDRRDERREDRERERERYRERERERDRERDDRDRRKKRNSPEGRRSIRLSERVLAAVPPMSKEERRRAFAEAAAAADLTRRQQDQWQYWHHSDAFHQMFPPGMMPNGPNMIAGGPGGPSLLPGAPNMIPGAPNMIPGAPNMIPGAPNMMPGGPNLMPGGPNMIPGGPNMMPGGPNMMPGGPNMVPGGPNMIPGGPNMMPGAPNMMSGAPNMMTGAPNMMSGAPNMMPGGPHMVPGGPNMMGMMPNMMPGMMPQDIPPEWIGPNGEYQGPPGFFPGAQSFCMPQANMMGMSGFGMGGFMFGQQVPFQQHAPTHPTDIAQPPNVQLLAGDETKEVVLPSMWRSAQDTRGRTYYYHVKFRQPTWVPPDPPPLNAQGGESSSEEDEPAVVEADVMRRPAKGKVVEGVNGLYEVMREDHKGLIPDHALVSVKTRKRRPGLVTERPISPRTEEDKLAGKLEVKRYKQTKEKLRRRKEKILQKVKILAAAKRKGKDSILPVELKMLELADSESSSEQSESEEREGEGERERESERESEWEVSAETARRCKEQFRSSMARAMVQLLNLYRRSDAPLGRITCTHDFKHLARKLTHFVMLKELKHCRSLDELVVTDSVRSKAKEFVRKYMAKFGPVYRRPAEEAD